MTVEKIIMLVLCLALYAMWVAVALTIHREDRGGGVKSNTKTTPATPKSPPPPKKSEREDDRK